MSGELRGPLFDGLDWAARQELHAQLRPVVLAAGEVLCHAGDLSDSLYVVERGVLRVLDGARDAPLGRQRAGDVVGEVALLTREPRTATLVADMPTEVLELSRDDFLLAAVRYPVLVRVPAECPYRSELLAYCDRQVAVAHGDDPAPEPRAGGVRRGRGVREQHRRLDRRLARPGS